MDYDLSRLSTRSFEQLIQALSIREMGAGVVIFGDGPDGGREAVFEGTIPFPSTAEPWSGYGVIQAKFKQRPEGTTKDTIWALKELKNELKKFTDDKRDLRKPDYYIFATNITLSSVVEKGGKDQVTEAINEFKSAVGLKDFQIWDYDQIRTLLDSNEGIRTTYSAWTMPGDVLSSLIKSMELKQKDFKKIMRNFVQKELIAERYIKLGQADHDEKEQIPLAKVFVDLPISTNDLSSNDPTAIKKLLSISEQLLNNSETTRTQTNSHKQYRNNGKVVFVGGPGQGKSTLTQFFCQSHRVAFIDLAQASPTWEVQSICNNIKTECKTEGLTLPLMPRFPIRIELNQFATTLAKKDTSSLFDYILQRIKAKTDYELDPEDLREWLKHYPWLVALDGLDEVPSSSNRSQVLDAVQDFLIDAHDCDADLLIIATTRPQGYNEDFSTKEYEHFQLAHLDREHALHYSKRLITQKFKGDEDKINLLLGRMQRASQESATARLMRSPLQVTIMALLVESLGEPPKERWRLFSEYYRIINRREKERDIPAARLLDTYQTDIDSIHQRVGLKLQATSERSGGTEALLTVDEFDEIVETRLNEEGHTGKEADKLKKEIVDAAMVRLVFLVAPKQESVGFEIRSLQEYMAAECLMNTKDDQKIKNLRSIMFASHWRNVFLFAAGRCFYTEQHLRSDIAQLCSELNEGYISDSSKIGNLGKLTLAGSQLALEILEDGVIESQPKHMKTFLRLALKLLELPPSGLVKRLADIYESKYSDIFKEEIKQQLSKSSNGAKTSAWHFLIQLSTSENDWVGELIESKFPSDENEALDIVKPLIHASDGIINPCLCDIWVKTILKLPIPIRSDLDPIKAKFYKEGHEGLIKLHRKATEQHISHHEIQNVLNSFEIRILNASKKEKVIEAKPKTHLPDNSHPTMVLA